MAGELFDYTGAKNETAAKNQARADLTQLFAEFLKERFGEDKAGLIDKNTVAFIFGTVNDNDGCPCDMVATIKPTIKAYQDHNGTKRFTEAFDFYSAVEFYAEHGVAMDK